MTDSERVLRAPTGPGRTLISEDGSISIRTVSTTKRLRKVDRGDCVRVIDETSGVWAEGESYEEALEELVVSLQETNDAAAAIRALEGSDEAVVRAFLEMTRDTQRRFREASVDESMVDEAIEWARSR